MDECIDSGHVGGARMRRGPVPGDGPDAVMSPQYQGCDSYSNRSRAAWRKRSSEAVQARRSKRTDSVGHPGDVEAKKTCRDTEPDTM